MKVTLQGRYELVLKPETRATANSVHIELRNISDADAYTLVNRFLSVLSWCSGQPLEILDPGLVSQFPAPLPRQERLPPKPIDLNLYRDIPRDSKARLALALYHEALTVNSIPFSFLSFFKILNIFWNDKWRKKNGRRQNEIVEGLRGALPHLKSPPTLARLAELSKQVPDVSEYLYESGRCAVAHAHAPPAVDPDNVSESRRLSLDIWVVRAVAEYLIETEFKISREIIAVG